MVTMNMSTMVWPQKVESDAVTQNYGRFVISPLESGYGVTLGNALRRVLLASLEGAAVTSIRVSDVHHEFFAFESSVVSRCGGYCSRKSLSAQLLQFSPKHCVFRLGNHR